MDGWARLGRWPAVRMLAVIALTVFFFAFPWPSSGTQTYAAYAPGLASVSPANATSVQFDAGNQSIFVASPPPAAGPVRVDLLRTHYSFGFSSTAIIRTQAGYDAADWRDVSASGAFPPGATNFTIDFKGTNSTTQLAEIEVTGGPPPLRLLFFQNFTQSQVGWALNGSAMFGAFGTPPRPALQIENSGGRYGSAVTSMRVPIPANITNVTVSGQIRFQGLPGAFAISLNTTSATGAHLGNVTDWGAWTQYIFPVAPLSVLLWSAGVASAVSLAFLANSTTAGILAIQISESGQLLSTQPLSPYRVGEPIGVLVNRTLGESFQLTMTFPTGPPIVWSSSSASREPGFTDLVANAYMTLSISALSPAGLETSGTLKDATYTFVGSGGFYPLATTAGPAITALVVTVGTLVLLSPEWTQGVVRLRVRGRTRSPAYEAVRRFVQTHGVVLALTVGALASYAAIAWSFGGHPYDNWSFTVWNYSGQVDSVRGIYIQTQFVGDAVVRGGTVPWGSVGFVYGPLSGYLFAGMSAVVPALNTYPTANALFGAFEVQAEIKWILGLFTIAAGIAAYFGIYRATHRRELAAIGLVLLVFNPAVGWDSVVWGETDSIMYFLFIVFAVAAVYRPTFALAVTACALAVKETGVILLFPSLLLVIGPGIPSIERLRRVTVGVVTLLLVTVPLLIWGILPSAFFSPFLTVFGVFLSGSTIGTPVVSPETYTVWTLFTGLQGAHGLGRLFTPSASPLIGGLTYAVAGIGALAVSWLVLWAVTRRGSTAGGLAFWMTTTAFGAITFTALLTGTGSRYYTLALPGLACMVVLLWGYARPWVWRATVATYLVVTAISFWTMYGLFTQIMKTDVPDIRGLALSYNPASRFVETWYLNNTLITLGSLGAIAAVILASLLLAELGDVRNSQWWQRASRWVAERRRGVPSRTAPEPAPDSTTRTAVHADPVRGVRTVRSGADPGPP